mmetsp:Transcript_81438/g.226859  ORF Transcript_81438/g.226859 Transcript_81438/m.226859 type:complete len:234 (+) Transcript_81438:421-1122(+)
MSRALSRSLLATMSNVQPSWSTCVPSPEKRSSAEPVAARWCKKRAGIAWLFKATRKRPVPAFLPTSMSRTTKVVQGPQPPLTSTWPPTQMRRRLNAATSSKCNTVPSTISDKSVTRAHDCLAGCPTASFIALCTRICTTGFLQANAFSLRATKSSNVLAKSLHQSPSSSLYVANAPAGPLPKVAKKAFTTLHHSKAASTRTRLTSVVPWSLHFNTATDAACVSSTIALQALPV